MEQIQEFIGWGCMVLGAFFCATGAIGVLRMPDFFTRLHAASIKDSFGVPLLLFGLMVHYGFTLLTGKLFLLILFLLITGSTATHALAKAAAISGQKPLLYTPEPNFRAAPVRRSQRNSQRKRKKRSRR